MSSSKNALITRSKAICLVLDMVPTEENRRQATRIMDNSPFDVTYISQLGPLEPIALGRTKIAKNPYTYKTYPTTPPTSPTLRPTTGGSDDDGDCVTDDSTSSIETTKSYTPAAVASMVESIYFKDVDDDELYEKRHFTTTDLFNDCKKLLPNLHRHATLSKFSAWIRGCDLGKKSTVRVNGKPIRGRTLYRLKDAAMEQINETSSSFRREMETSDDRWVNIGYIRRSPGKESDATRKRLLNAMITKLRNRCFCEYVFASTNCTSNSRILERDFNNNNNNYMARSLNGCDGDVQNMVDLIAHSAKKVRLCVISYAGLSNNPDDLYHFLKSCKMVKAVVVDHGHRIETLPRHLLLHGNKKMLQLFKSRTGCVKRAA